MLGQSLLGTEDRKKASHSDREKNRLKVMLKKKKEREDEQLKSSASGEDPFYVYGFGLVAYRNSLFILAVAFAVFSLLAIPIEKTYNSGHGFTSSDKYGKGTLTHLGYNSMNCLNKQLVMEKFVLQCPYGQMSRLKSFGINPKTSKRPEACLVEKKFENV